MITRVYRHRLTGEVYTMWEVQEPHEVPHGHVWPPDPDLPADHEKFDFKTPVHEILRMAERKMGPVTRVVLRNPTPGQPADLEGKFYVDGIGPPAALFEDEVHPGVRARNPEFQGKLRKRV